MRRLGWALGLGLLLGTVQEVQAAPDAAGSLRIVRRTHPDPAWMLEHLAGRLELCLLEQRAQGVNIKPPALPSAAAIGHWVTAEDEVLVAQGQYAHFSTTVFVAPDPHQACRWTFYRQLSASTETVCQGRIYSGQAGAEPQGGGQAPSFSESPALPAARAKACLAEAAKPKAWALDLAQGAVGGRPCRWQTLGGTAEVSGAGVVQPQQPGLYACSHPREFDGSLRLPPSGADLSLRVLRVLAPGEKPEGLSHGQPEANLGQMVAEVVEDGAAIPAARFSHAAVEAHVKQPLTVPLGGQP